MLSETLSISKGRGEKTIRETAESNGSGGGRHSRTKLEKRCKRKE